MRKTMVLACAAALAACSWPVAAPPPPHPMPSAPRAPALQALAEQGRYAEVIALLEAQAAGGQPSAGLLGNLGYAYYLDGRLLPAQAALERACLLEPGNALAWERLAALLEATGDSARALEAMRHARTLRELAPAPAPAATPAAPAADLWPADLARVEVRQVSAGLVEVARVPARGAAGALRLEVSNGNGVRGMAADMARRLRAGGMQVVRLSNTLPFNVQETRVEVRGQGEPQLRIVLGKDMAPGGAGIKKPPAWGRRQAP
ncbi:LytR C-terminal domain-containing protein [Pseudoduganella sp.]|uniref:LytR C-terminal domain-containing protein n=1 Tax=Pseudoduganella sp. TaxID=1880898 RepID=UPI0035B0F9EE